MSSWASISSADFAAGGWFNAPSLTEHPAFRPCEDTVDETGTAIHKRPDSGVSVQSSRPGAAVGPLASDLKIEGGGDKIPMSSYRPLSPSSSTDGPVPRISKPESPVFIPPRRIKIGTAYYALTPIDTVEDQAPMVRSIEDAQVSNGVPPTSPAMQRSRWEHSSPDQLPFAGKLGTPRIVSYKTHQQLSPPHEMHLNHSPSTVSSSGSSYTPSIFPRRATVAESFGEQAQSETPEPRRKSLAVTGGFRLRQMFKTEPLIKAAKAGEAYEVGRLLAPGHRLHSISVTDWEGYMAIHWAARLGHSDVLKVLLEGKADIEARTHSTDRTPLFLAAQAGHLTTAQILLEAGALVNATSKFDGATALHQAARSGNEEIVNLLILHGANVNKNDVEGMPPLMWATQGGQRHSTGTSIAQILVRHGANLEARIKRGRNLELASKEGLTILHKAVGSDNIPLAKLLLEIGADVNADAAFGMRAVHRAAAKGSVEMTRLLLDAGADLTCVTEEGWTPLHCAARYGHRGICELLMQYGADASARTKNGLQARELAIKNGHQGVL